MQASLWNNWTKELQQEVFAVVFCGCKLWLECFYSEGNFRILGLDIYLFVFSKIYGHLITYNYNKYALTCLAILVTVLQSSIISFSHAVSVALTAGLVTSQLLLISWLVQQLEVIASRRICCYHFSTLLISCLYRWNTFIQIPHLCFLVGVPLECFYFLVKMKVWNLSAWVSMLL